MSNKGNMKMAAASLQGRRVWPNPDKKLGLCDVNELEKELNNKNKAGIFLNPNKRLRDCSEEELEQQLKNFREYKQAEIYPNPEKQLQDCGIRELEEKVKEAKSKIPPKFTLPLISDSIFLEVIAEGFLVKEDITELMKVN